MRPLPSRVVTRHLLASPNGDLTVLGPFHLFVPAKLSGFLPGFGDTLTAVWSLYHNAGLSLGSGPIVVAVVGKVQSFHNVTDGSVHVAPRHMGTPKDPVLVHELAHWFHYNRVPGGVTNPKIVAKYRWALASLSPKTSGLTKGLTYEKVGWDNPHTRDTPYIRVYKVVSLTPTKVTVEITNPSGYDLKYRPGALREVVPRGYVEGLVGKDTGPTVSAWVPSDYAKTNVQEWFAELVTPYVLHPGGSDPEVRSWLEALSS